MHLADIRETASKFAATIAQILDVDVMIVDRSHNRIANTFRYVDEPPPVRDGSVTGRVLSTGKVAVVRDKSEIAACKDCADKADCRIDQIISVPILYEGAVAGAIDLLVPTGKKSTVFDNLEISIDFLERMAELLSSKLRNIDDYKRLELAKKEREILLDFIEEAIVYTNEVGEIIHWNSQFAKLFGVEPGSVGRPLSEVLDHPVIDAAIRDQRPFSNREFHYTGMRVEFRGFLGCRVIQRNGVRYGALLSFRSLDKAYSVVNEISQTRSTVSFEFFRTADPAMRAVIEEAKRLSVGDDSVLVTGGPGLGKSMMARAIHDYSDRGSRPFITVDCRGFSPEYLEEELFGRSEDGEPSPSSRLRIAQGGSIFFRHVEELPLRLQRRLTDLIRARKFDEARAVTARFIFSSGKSVTELAREGNFDEELAVRISRNLVEIPSLSERPADTRLIIEEAVAAASRMCSYRGDTGAIVAALSRRHWAENVRQIERAVEQLFYSPPGSALDEKALERRLSLLDSGSGRTLRPVGEVEKDLIIEAMSRYPKKDDAARALGIGRATLYRKIKEYSLE